MATQGNGSDPAQDRPRRLAEDPEPYTPRYARQPARSSGTAQPGTGPARPHPEEPFDVDRVGLRDSEPGPGQAPGPQSEVAGDIPVYDRSRGFGRTMVRTTVGTLLPGTGLLGTRRTLLGLVIFTVSVIGLAALGITARLRPQILIGLVVSSTRFTALGIIIAAAAVLWVALVVGTYLISRPRRMTRTQRIIGSLVVFVMSLLLAVPTSLASAYAFTTGSVISQVFGNEHARSKTRPNITNQANPFADKERLNILLLGGDSGAGRDQDLGVRTDTVILASIDTHTGNTVLIQLPRNLENVPFPTGSDLAKVYPNGRVWDGTTGSEDSYMLNAVWNQVPQEHPELFKDTDFPGADATKLAVSGITGLSVDYFVMINIDGIQKLVDAMGGVTVNVNFPIAKGGHVDGYGDEACGVDGNLSVGANQHLDGANAMWYARSRCNDPDYDYGRMRRQSCLINAVIKQANPQTMLTRYEAIASAGQDMMSTDIPENLLDDIADLALKVKDGQVTRVVFAQSLDGTPVANEIVPGNPDYPEMRSTINSAILASQATSSASATTSQSTAAPTSAAATGGASSAATTTETTSSAPASTSTTTPAENLANVCSYSPVK